MTAIRAKYLRLSVEKNALDYLARAVDFIQEAESDLLAWKWVINSLHGALYGFAIAALQGTNPDNVTVRHRSGNEKLISFSEALSRCQDPRFMTMLTSSQHLILTDGQKESIRILKNVFRNSFEHYIPRGWSIEIHGFPEIAIDVLDAIRFLALESGNYVHLTRSEEKRIKSLIFRAKRHLRTSKLHKEARIATSRVRVAGS
jgi:hypothetical protein